MWPLSLLGSVGKSGSVGAPQSVIEQQVVTGLCYVASGDLQEVFALGLAGVVDESMASVVETRGHTAVGQRDSERLPVSENGKNVSGIGKTRDGTVSPPTVGLTH
jgi:hypothetical protein